MRFSDEVFLSLDDLNKSECRVLMVLLPPRLPPAPLAEYRQYPSTAQQGPGHDAYVEVRDVLNSPKNG
jgi:hypothetical protein